MATCTSKATGNWSDGSTWDTDPAPPANGDTVIIANGHTVTYDEDMSGWANGVTLTINDGGTLLCSTSTGSYYLKNNAQDITVNGTLQAGTDEDTPLPPDVSFTIDMTSSAKAIKGSSTGRICLYCTEPTYKFVTTTAIEPVAETVIAVDTDVTGDIWANGDTILYAGLWNIGGGWKRAEEHTISAIASGTITLNVGIINEPMPIGSKILLISRNIRIINSTTNAVQNGYGHHIDVEFYNNNSCFYNVSHATTRSYIGGAILQKNSDYIFYSNSNYEFHGAIGAIHSVTAHAHFGYGFTLTSNSIIAGCYSGAWLSYAVTANGVIAAGTYGLGQCTNSVINGDLIGVGEGLYNCRSITLYGDIANCGTGINECTAFSVANNTIGLSIGGITSTCALQKCGNGNLYNVNFNATTEFSEYTNITIRHQSNYVESFDHDQAENAFKAWCLGGIVTSQTATPPTGYDIWYEHACENSTFPCFRQYQATVLPGTAIEVNGKIRIADGEDLSSNPPALQIIDYFADPLIDSTQEPLDEDEIPEPNGGVEAGWQDVSVIWANQSDKPRMVLVRMIAYHATADVDEVWSIADYQDQINVINNKIKRLGPTGQS